MTGDHRADFSTMSLDEVAAYGLQARRKADTEREFWMSEARRACLHLNANDWTWQRIGKFMGVNLASVYRWASYKPKAKP